MDKYTNGWNRLLKQQNSEKFTSALDSLLKKYCQFDKYDHIDVEYPDHDHPDEPQDKEIGEGEISELSPETKASAMGKMRDKGQTGRADRLYLQNLEKFVGMDIFDNFKITEFKNQEHVEDKVDGKITIVMVNANGPGQVVYYNKMDYYDFTYSISRKDARLLSKIAVTMNPETQYKNGTGDFNIIGY